LLSLALTAQGPLLPPALKKAEPIGPRIDAARRRIVEGDARGAAADLTRLLESNPESPEVYYWLGIALLELRQIDDARAALSEAVELRGGVHPDAHYHLGLVALQTGAPADAVPLLERALAQSTAPFPAAENALAAAYFSVRNFESAIELLGRMTTARPEESTAQHLLGLALEQRFIRGGSAADLDRAIRAQQRAVDSRPDYAIAHRDLGLTLLWSARAAEAATHLERFATIQPSHPSAGAFRGLAGRLRAGLSQQPGGGPVAAAPTVATGPGRGATVYSPRVTGAARPSVGFASEAPVVDGVVLTDGSFFSLGPVTPGPAAEDLDAGLATSTFTPAVAAGRPIAVRVLVSK
jgi:tetratricopeptide (TPR) repeat protein